MLNVIYQSVNFPSNKASASLAFCGIDFKSLMSNDNGIAPISSATLLIY
jgi:hypothetical protein